ncbi:metallophosphoesterase family protein [Lactiplantibacillus mudanjiangensis]|uniref:Diadenosine tetraphosphatase/threonine protein phosphatases [Lactobacillus zymae] n=1 Tax=Lactiplantibacillus mudanjiangensis TaxID=1296538 RepID=A0A660E4L0_9LACO|nr:metallophosphoesterase family protein [Lactiplantibacillus mudanjiangensis]VDG20156.1 Diadenosine tetraphosphatase/threonine protein phosphatases [Lactobacillus zymae] [Lactiplantibacillus mudanjiangensis]VDG24151.1 Diadenosine tetraphosphatase/threonine protein phosphatases [Lactobacillus zymae] [Lactiplantibacillus mudanjiangensis]VDG30328.1 Diadenosine tetraphosphatase/threonine protein phosphatases [Lactobacillus zymae] [Lactiplantibacillus mudanjiangensis]VDG33551.1 Diadenosine tetrapho
MTKIAVMADVHGNVTALKAAIADAQQQGCTTYWFLGDLFLPGPGTTELLTMLDALPIEAYVMGNWESTLLEALDHPFKPRNAIDIYYTCLADYAYHRLSTQALQRIRQLPLVQTKTIAGLQYQLTHNELAKNWGGALMPTENQPAFDDLSSRQADVMVYAHIHHQLLRQSSAGQLILNPGTIGMPFQNWSHFATDLRAQYAIITPQPSGAVPEVDFRRVAYDADAELALAQAKQLPYLPLYDEQLHTGVVHTHDEPTLQAMTKRLGYDQQLDQLLKP